jgi:hypothetical protein
LVFSRFVAAAFDAVLSLVSTDKIIKAVSGGNVSDAVPVTDNVP